MNHRAVIDLGTNTFHLLIVEMEASGAFREIFRERIFVRLAEEGIQRIGNEAFRRGLDAMLHFKGVLEKYRLPVVKAFGTAALRTAENASDFIREVKILTAIEVQIINGLEEAELIYKGVRKAVPFSEEKQLIMDIGGGSVEFVIADNSKVYWADSFLAGVGILHTRFHHHDPILPEEIAAISDYLDTTLSPVLDALRLYPAYILTGSSGAFDTVTDMMSHNSLNPNFVVLDLSFFAPLYERIINSNKAERQAMPEIPEERIEMIVVAMILINFMLQRGKSKQVYVSSYAMKEGMLLSEEDFPHEV